MNTLADEIKKNIIEELNLSHELDDINHDTPLFNSRYTQLDSLDALRIIVMLEKKYGIKIKDLSQRKKILYSFDAIAKLVDEHRQQQARQ
ncbi:MAG TPA: phosphopantetheine-binding protein [Bacteroidales bacterium]|nr:phosphopantetheine-binding protein [Bacteroidales bacterium]HQI70675.1 phosphopantetheine-binding protein [Bacteroidales bacterium]